MNLNQWLKQVITWNKSGRDPFVTIEFSENLPLKITRELCGLLDSIDTAQGIRIERPPEGHLHFRAFLTEERLADREQRNVQPPELHITKKEDGIAAAVTLITETWHENQLRPELSFEEIKLENPQDLRAQLDRTDPRLPVLLIYSDGDVSYGDILPYANVAVPSHHLIHVFLK